MNDLPDEVHSKLVLSIERTVALGVTKAKSFADPHTDTGKFKNDMNGNVEVRDGEIFGFINLYSGEVNDALAAHSINYGWGNMPYGLHVRALTKKAIATRHKRSVRRQLKQAIKDSL